MRADIKPISTLHYLTQDGIPGYSHPELAKMACEAGIKWLQLRVKDKPYNEWLAIAKEVKKITDSFGCTLIVNDNVNVAFESDADGVHLGKNDIPPLEARKILGNNKTIGGTANTIQDIQYLLEVGVEYIGLGPFRFTATKKNLSPVLGIEKLKKIIAFQSNIPLIIIGGITKNDVELILNSGAHGIAVSSAINTANDKYHAAKEIISKVSQFSKNYIVTEEMRR
jgi:thiamine-phosphate pyrophosphorylase